MEALPWCSTLRQALPPVQSQPLADLTTAMYSAGLDSPALVAHMPVPICALSAVAAETSRSAAPSWKASLKGSSLAKAAAPEAEHVTWRVVGSSGSTNERFWSAPTAARRKPPPSVRQQEDDVKAPIGNERPLRL